MNNKQYYCNPSVSSCLYVQDHRVLCFSKCTHRGSAVGYKILYRQQLYCLRSEMYLAIESHTEQARVLRPVKCN